METRDYTEKQIDQLGQLLTAIFNRFLKKKENDLRPTINEMEQTFSDELSLDLKKMITLNRDDLLKLLVKENRFSLTHLEMLAKMIARLDFDNDDKIHNQLRACELSILEYVASQNKDYSFEREERIASLKPSKNG